MLILHEMARIKESIHKYPEALETHLKDIQSIQNEYKRGLPSKRIVEDLIKYAREEFIKHIQIKAG